MDFDTKLHNMTTLIHTQTAHGVLCSGTGFFYRTTEQADLGGPEYQWVKVTGQWVVTNRHVVMPRHNGVENRPLTITIYLRRWNDQGRLEWDPVVIPAGEFDELVRFHPNECVDVALIKVLDLFRHRVESNKDNFTYVPPFGLSQGLLPRHNTMIQVEAASDVLVVGYPRGFYDDVNLFPIVKSGIVASRWGVNFQGHPYFLIDSRLFPGSSGSAVISKPIDLVVREGDILLPRDDEKAFVLLGVYSGEYQEQSSPVEVGDLTITQTLSYDLGVVWYAEVIEEIISNYEDD